MFEINDALSFYFSCFSGVDRVKQIIQVDIISNIKNINEI